MGSKHGPLTERFWAKVHKTDSCWLWTAGVDTKGYGHIRDESGKLVLAHRTSYQWAYGNLAPETCCLHHCDVNYPVGDIAYRRCVRPEHLFPGDRADNAADMVAKGRVATGDRSSARLYPERRKRGEAHPKARLTAEHVRVIRRLSEQGLPQRRIAKEYGVGKGTIQAILQGVSWHHVI